MDLRQLAHFVAVADARSFTAAAADLHMSQPALSQSVARLEAELETVLLLRNKQHPGVGVQLTIAGRSLYDDARDLLLRASRAAERAKRAGRSTARIPVALGFASSTPQHLVSAALTAAADAAGVDVVPVQLEWGHEHEAISSGLVDLSFLQYPLGDPVLDHDVTGIVRVPRVAVLPAGHPLAAAETVARAQLHPLPILDPGFVDGPPGLRAFWLGDDDRSDADAGTIVGPPARTVAEMHSFVAAGRGIAIASRVVADQSNRADIVHRPIADIDPVEVGIARLHDDHRAAVVRFYDELAQLSALD